MMFSIIKNRRETQPGRHYTKTSRLSRLAILCIALLYFGQGTVSAASPTAPVAPLSPAQVQALQEGIVYFDTSAGCTESTSSGLGGTLDQFLQAEALLESGDNITAGSPAHASGKYQFEPSTWQSWSQHYYGPGQQYPYASAAPEDVQDAVMYLGYLIRYNAVSGDIFALAVSHYGGDSYLDLAHTDPSSSTLDQVPAPGNTLTLRQYGDDIVNAIQSGTYNGKSLSSVSLSYTSAPDFQTWLAQAGGAPTSSQTSTTSTSTTDCSSSGGSGVAAGQFVFYSQADPRWANLPYGPGTTIQEAGCGPSSVAEVVATLANSSVTPADTAAWGDAHQSDTGAGSIWDIMLRQGPENWGLQSTSIGTNMNEAVTTLNNGGLVIIAGTGAAPFTSEGHILVLRGIASNGDFLVGDPNSPPPPSPDVGNPENQFSAAELLGAGLQTMYAVTK